MVIANTISCDGGAAADMGCLIVCIGLSAGGLRPLQAIFQRLNPATGMAFVVVAHLSRTTPTELPSLLRDWSKMPAQLAHSGLPIEANQIYVIPPAKEITLKGANFCVQPRSKTYGFSNVITLFLQSLARRRAPAGICVILSGIDGDGAAALPQFRSAGGITIVQSVTTADHPDMPGAAIRTGCADYVLPPEAIALKLDELARPAREEACK